MNPVQAMYAAAEQIRVDDAVDEIEIDIACETPDGHEHRVSIVVRRHVRHMVVHPSA